MKVRSRTAAQKRHRLAAVCCEVVAVIVMVAIWVVVRLESEDPIGYARLPVNNGTARSGNALTAP